LEISVLEMTEADTKGPHECDILLRWQVGAWIILSSGDGWTCGKWQNAEGA
jgi:hypothetical protein